MSNKDLDQIAMKRSNVSMPEETLNQMKINVGRLSDKINLDVQKRKTTIIVDKTGIEDKLVPSMIKQENIDSDKLTPRQTRITKVKINVSRPDSTSSLGGRSHRSGQMSNRSGKSQTSKKSSGGSVASYGSRRSRSAVSHQKSQNKSVSKKSNKPQTDAQKLLDKIQEKFKALRHLPKQRLHPFDFAPEELEDLKKLFPEFKVIPEHLPQNRPVKNTGIPKEDLAAELQKRIPNIHEQQLRRLINQCDRKNDNKITWNEFLNFLTNEGIRRETVNDAQLYGYGVKRLKKHGKYHLRTVDQYHSGPEKLAEHYIDGMVLIKIKNIRLLLNLFDNKEAKLFDLRSFQPIQHLIFQSDYSIPKPKKVDNRRKVTTAGHEGTVTVDSMSKTNDGQNLVQMHSINAVNLQQHISEANDSASITSFAQQISGNVLVEPMIAETVTEDKTVDANDQAQSSQLDNNQKAPIQIVKKISSQQQPAVKNRPISQKARRIATSIEKNAKNSNTNKVPMVNFHPQKQQKSQSKINNINTKAHQGSGVPTTLQSFVDSELDLSVVNEINQISIGNQQLNKQLTAKGQATGSDHGSVSTINQHQRVGAQQRPQTQNLINQDGVGSESDMAVRPVSQIQAWKLPNSHHRKLVEKRRIQEKEKKDKEEREKKNSNILGIADLSSKNSARDFAQRATEKSKKTMNYSRALTAIADSDADIKQDYQKNKQDFEKLIRQENKRMKAYDSKKEEKFYDAYKEKERADYIMTRDLSFDRIGNDTMVAGDSSSKAAYSSVGGSRLGQSLKRRRPTMDQDSSSRVSAVGSKSVNQAGGRSSANKMVGDGLINSEIDYFGRIDLVDRAIQQTRYVPLALRDQASKLKLCNQHIDKLMLEETKCERALKNTTQTKNQNMKKVLRVKETNRFFFTKNEYAPPYYYPEKSQIEDIQYTSTTKDSSSPNEENSKPHHHLTPRTQAKIDHKLLFGEDIVPIPCEPGQIKKALLERKARDAKLKGYRDEESPPIYKRRTDISSNPTKKIKTTKEIYTVAADFCLSNNGEKSLVALALIDEQILIYQLKQSGVKISMVESFSFYAKFPGKAAVSSLCLDHYVTDGRPIICIGSQLGDILIYYLDHVNSAGKVCQKLMIGFNFFERGINKVASISESDDDDDDSLLNSRSNTKTFVVKVGSDATKTPSQQYRTKNITYNNNSRSDSGSDSHSGYNKTSKHESGNLKLTSQHFSTTIVEATKQIQDDFWEVLMNARKPEEGPDGIQIWNCIYRKIKDQESAVTLCKSLIEMKLEAMDSMDEIIERWQLCMKRNGGVPKDALLDFDHQMYIIREERARQAKEKAKKAADKRTKGMANASSANNSFSRQKSAAKDGGVAARRQNNSLKKSATNKKDNAASAAVKKDGRKDSFALNGILEDPLENVSTQDNDRTFDRTNGMKSNTGQKGGKDSRTGKSALNTHKTPKKPISKLRYVKDIGLIVTAFNGTIKFFDAFNFYQIWKNDNKSRSDNQHTSIGTFDVSSSLGVMVTGGAEGLMLAIDPHALGVTNQAEAHKGKDILNVFIYDEEQQIISICEDRTVCLWDAFRLEKLQMIRDISEANHIPKFSSAAFDNQDGILYVGDQMLQIWKCSVDPQVEINALQIQTLSAALVKERNLTQLIKLSESFSKQPIKSSDQRTGKVLISQISSLVEVLSNEKTLDNQYFATVDTENLVRFWNLKEHQTNVTFKIPMKKRVTACDINKECTLIAVGNQIGEAFVANSKSGGIIYKLPGADEEIGAIKFLSGQSEFWIVAALWHGKMVFWSQPNEQNNFNISAKVRIGHRGDINTLDCQANYIISGGQDGLLGVWNQFSGVLKYAIKLPAPVDQSISDARERMRTATENAINENNSIFNKGNSSYGAASTQIRRTIVGLMFHPHWRNVALVLQEGGNIHAVDVSNGAIVNEFLAMVQMNSSWAIDPVSYKVMVVGDQGKAILFDASMGCKVRTATVASDLNTGDGTSHHNGFIKEVKAVQSKRVPVYQPNIDPATGDKEKWHVVRSWFTAHTFSKTEPKYVNIVKYSISGHMFITSTNFGEVKLWDNQQCQPLGMLNSHEFDPPRIMKYIKGSQEQTVMRIIPVAQERIANVLGKTLIQGL